MKVVICAIAKCENEYINDWINYHLNLGVDEIHIYDNNDIDYEPLENRINSDKVYIVKIPNAKKFQSSTYTEFYNKNKDKFDWCIFIDIDEFIVLNKWNNIKEFLSDSKISSYPVVRLNWHMYGDDDKIKRDLSKSVYDGITKRLKGHRLEKHGKEIIKGGLNGVNIPSSHYCLINEKLPKQIMPDYKETVGTVGGLHDCQEAFINHYMTKTLDEFINQKIVRGTDAGFPDKVIDFSYYWKINKKTDEKIEYIKKLGFEI